MRERERGARRKTGNTCGDPKRDKRKHVAAYHNSGITKVTGQATEREAYVCRFIREREREREREKERVSEVEHASKLAKYRTFSLES